jgi:hypothetical protein
MRQTIAVEPDLTPVKDYLTDKGYDVQNINYGEMNSRKTSKFDAYVVTGIDKNFMGMTDTDSKAVIIDAAGMTPEQIYHELQIRLQ